jgi:hypothetical protein
MIRRAFFRLWQNVSEADEYELPLHLRLCVRFPRVAPRLLLVVLMPLAFIEDLIRYRKPRWVYWLVWRNALLGRDSFDLLHPEAVGKARVCFPDGSEHMLTFGATPVVGEPLDAELPEEVGADKEWIVGLVAIALADDSEYYVEVEPKDD